MPSRTLKTYFPVVVLLGVFTLLALGAMWKNSPNPDEVRHLAYGRSILFSLNAERTRDSVMPVSALNAVPQSIAKILPDGRLKEFLEGYGASRCVTVTFALLLGCLVFQWSRELYGRTASLLSLFLFAFSPTVIAHSGFVTTDIYAALGITASMFSFWRFMGRPNWNSAALFGLILGASQVLKYTAVYLYPLIILIVLLRYAKDWFARPVAERTPGRVFSATGAFLKYGVLIAVIQIAVVNVGFIFDRTFTPLNEYEFKSTLFGDVQSSLEFLGTLPVPVPYPYIEGLDLVKAHEANGAGFGEIYMLGKLAPSGSGGFNGYFFVALLFKVPLAIQLALILAAGHYAWRAIKDRPTKQGINHPKSLYAFYDNEIFLLLPVLFFLIYFNFFFGAQTGIRYCLVFFPALFVFAGSVFKGLEWRNISAKSRVVAVSLAVCLVGSVISHYPFYIGYFNELVWERAQAYKILADSNLDWDHDSLRFQKYMDSNPNAIYLPDAPVAGTVVVNANALTGVSGPEYFEQFRWLRDHFEPVGHAGGPSYLRYEVSAEALSRTR